MANDGTFTYTYDAAGNITQRSKGTGLETWDYRYDTKENLTDTQGSVRDLVNSSGQVQDHLDYAGFGVRTESTAAVGDGYSYTGLKEQKAAGVVLADERALLVTPGRWMQEDPIFFRGGD